MQPISPLAFIPSLLVPRNTIAILHLNYYYYVAMTPILITIYKGIDYLVSSKESQNVYNGSYPPRTPRLMIPSWFIQFSFPWMKYFQNMLILHFLPLFILPPSRLPAEQFQSYYIISSVCKNLNLLLLDFWWAEL